MGIAHKLIITSDNIFPNKETIIFSLLKLLTYVYSEANLNHEFITIYN